MCPYLSYYRVGKLLSSFESGSSYSPKLGFNVCLDPACFSLQCMEALQSSPLPESAEILDILHRIEFEGLFFSHDKLAERQVSSFLLFIFMGGDETRLGYMQYVKGNQPNVPARTICRHGLYNSMVHARTSRYVLGQVDLFNFGADLIIFVEQFNEILHSP